MSHSVYTECLLSKDRAILGTGDMKIPAHMGVTALTGQDIRTSVMSLPVPLLWASPTGPGWRKKILHEIELGAVINLRQVSATPRP